MANNIVNRRKILVIDKEFQNKFIVKFLALACAGGLMSVLALFVYIHYVQTVTTVFRNSRLTIMSTADFILPSVVLSGLVTLVVVGAVTLLVALYVSHRIAGPAYRIIKDIEELSAGNLNKVVRVREKDELGAVVQALNAMTGKLRGDIASVKGAVEQLHTASATLPPRAAEQIKDIKKVLDRYHV